MTDLEIVNKAKNKAILRAEKAEKQLTKAKEIIRDFLSVAIDYIDPIDKNYYLIAEAEQLLKEE